MCETVPCEECGDQCKTGLCSMCQADKGLFQAPPKPQQEYNYHKLLLAYLKHVGECEGVSFLYSRGEPIKPLKGLTQEEMDELIRLDEQSND